jgi:hypothetical protein
MWAEEEEIFGIRYRVTTSEHVEHLECAVVSGQARETAIVP